MTSLCYWIDFSSTISSLSTEWFAQIRENSPHLECFGRRKCCIILLDFHICHSQRLFMLRYTKMFFMGNWNWRFSETAVPSAIHIIIIIRCHRELPFLFYYLMRKKQKRCLCQKKANVCVKIDRSTAKSPINDLTALLLQDGVHMKCSKKSKKCQYLR